MGHKVSVPDPERHRRAEQRAKRKRVFSDSEDVGNEASSEVATASTTSNKPTDDETDDTFMLEYQQLQRDNAKLKTENDELKKENDELKMRVIYLERTHISSEHLQQSDHLLKFYTGN